MKQDEASEPITYTPAVTAAGAAIALSTSSARSANSSSSCWSGPLTLRSHLRRSMSSPPDARLSGSQIIETSAPRAGTFHALIEAYKASPDFARKAVRTKELNVQHLRIITDRWGPLLVKGVRLRHVLELRDAFADTPRKADQLIALLSVVIGWGVPRDYADANPPRDRKTCRHGWLRATELAGHRARPRANETTFVVGGRAGSLHRPATGRRARHDLEPHYRRRY